MNKYTTSRPRALLLTLAATALLAACGKGQDLPQGAAPAADPNLVVTNAEMARNFQVAPLALQKFPDSFVDSRAALVAFAGGDLILALLLILS